MKDFTDVVIHIISQLSLVLLLLYVIGDDLIARVILLILVIFFPFLSYFRWIGINAGKKSFEDSGLESYKRVLMSRKQSTLIDKVCFISYLSFIIFAISFFCIKLFSK